MLIPDFIEKAIEGGWKGEAISYVQFSFPSGELNKKVSEYILKDKNYIRSMFLDPKAWQAVGKVEGWRVQPVRATSGPIVGAVLSETKEWQQKMHQMIDALVEGKSLEEFIETL